MRTGLIAAAVAATVAVVAAYGQPRPYKLPRTPIDPVRLSHDVRGLTGRAGDGRGRGVDTRIAYLVRRFKALGLKPGGERGGWTQAVPLIRSTIVGSPGLRLASGRWTRALAPGRDIVLLGFGPVDQVRIENAPMVFLGRGGDSAAWGDLSGKIAIILTGAGESGGSASEAARRGALAVLVVSDAQAEGAGWDGLAARGAGPQLALDRPASARALMLQGWLRRAAAVELFQHAGLDFDELARKADAPGFQPVALGDVALSAEVQLRRERVVVRNVLARLPGAGAAKQTVIYSAHWRPFDAGGGAPRPGAVDEGTGLAALLELARVYAHTTPTWRTVVFAAFADDERGHFGADWYVERPLYPLASTAADIDIAALQTAGPARDIVLAGAVPPRLEADLARAAARQGRRVTDRNRPQAQGGSDESSAFAHRGVPVLPVSATAGGPDLVKGGRAAGEAWLEDYLANRYRGPKDRWTPDWDLRGAALDVALVYDVGRDLANAGGSPPQKAGTALAELPARARGR